MVSLQGVVHVVLYLLAAGMIWALLWWLVDYCSPPEPFRKAIKVALAVLAVLILIGLILQFAGGSPLFRP